MKQKLFARLAVCSLMFLAVSAAAQMPQPFSADNTTTSTTGNLNMTGKVYFSFPKMRMDMTSTGNARPAGPFGGKMSMIVDGPAKTMYMLMTEQHMYMEFHMDQNNAMAQHMPKFEDMFRGGDPCAGREGVACKNLGNETVNGRSCVKWELTEKDGKKETFWMDQSSIFPSGQS